MQSKGSKGVRDNIWHLALLAVATAAGGQGMCNRAPFYVGFMDTNLTSGLSSIEWLQLSNSAAEGLQCFCCQCCFCCFSNVAELQSCVQKNESIQFGLFICLPCLSEH